MVPPPSVQPPPLAAVGLRAWFVAAAPPVKAGSADGDGAAATGPYPSEYVSRRAVGASRRPGPAPEVAFKPRQLSSWAGIVPPSEALPGLGPRRPAAIAVGWGGVRESRLRREVAAPEAGYLRRPLLVPGTQRLPAPRPVRQRALPEETMTEVSQRRRAVRPLAVEGEDADKVTAPLRAWTADSYSQLEERLLRKQRLDMHR